MTAELTSQQLKRLAAFAHDAVRIQDTSALMALVDKAFAAEFGHRLFTLLKVNRPAAVMGRIYSTNIEIDPVGGTKPIAQTDWVRQVIEDGRHFIGRNRDDLRKVFPEHEALFGIGCESVLNTPVFWRGAVIGSINILHEADHYTEHMCVLASLYAQYAAPAFLEEDAQ